MEEVGTQYEVGLKIVEPKFESERRWVASELKYIERRIRELQHLWRPLTMPALGVFRKQDWHAYAKQVEHYGRDLDKHERELEEEWLPFQVVVVNAGERDDANVHVIVSVDHGTVSEKHKGPERPERLDAPVKSPKLGLPHYSGFVRSGVRIGTHSLEAVLSRVEAGTSAEVTRQTLYLHYNDETRLRFEIRSKLVREQTGPVAT